MISQSSRLAAFKVTSIARNVTKQATNSSLAFKKTPGNSFGSFKEYRENMKTYGPLSASLASKRHIGQNH
ncbi:similar to Saccharomyces cerevisiae YJL133C-A Putative protein of unknown function [Maudiozyma saulgeensis]|uniref:Uncharacterized protein n=1 Tax=Maudiozyma saulgeensis TaxID=1789683 RepID=A0A1X7RB34_9SACH|nr:similar to Saccharomyces cerevisiae YJL133C-A Putative protein of unknown function [Kazachstania saulgeensis]